MGAFAIPVIAIVAIVIAAQVFSTGSTTTKQPVGDAATANPGSAQTTPDADANGEQGQEPDADANGDTGEPLHASKYGSGDPDYAQASGGGDSNETTPGEGPVGGFEAYLSAQRTYPATEIPPTVPDKAATTFEKIAGQDAKTGDPKGKGHQWQLFGPTENATQPGVTAFSGATNNTASRTTALLVSPDCGSKGNGSGCRVWAGVSGGGVWRTDDALAANPTWKQLKPNQLDQNSVGALTLDPTDPKGNTIYLGTGEGHRCSSGCEAGVGIYKSTNGGDKWTKLGDVCVSNGTYPCVTPGTDAFLGRGINSIVIDPRNANHIFVGSAQGVRGLSHVIGNGGTTRLEPGANDPGLYESTDGGATFTEIWNGSIVGSFGVTDVALDPLDLDIVYAAAFDAGVWRRDPGAAATAFNQVFAPQFPGGGTDRTMFAFTVKNGHTRIYLTEGTANAGGIAAAQASDFWRLDNANQTAAALLASQAAGATPPDPVTHTFPASYFGWQNLTSKTTGNPYFATDDFCTGQCWYDQDVYTPNGMPDTVYVIGSMEYGEQPCNTNGVGCGNGRSNGRTVLYSTTAGDPDGSATGPANMRTFTDLTYDATINHPSWCAFAPYFNNGCENAPNGIHPDEHAIAINPSNPTQIFEGSDGGLIRTSGQFADLSSQCDSAFRNGGGPLPTTSGSYLACQRLLSRAPTLLEHVDKKLSSTLQFIGVAINPSNGCQVLGGTQDNGTWANVDGCTNKTYSQVIYGDGGNAVFDGTQPGWLANEFTGGFGDSNFENGDPTKWVIGTGAMVASGETFAFYWPQIGDPNPVPGTHPLYNGGNHVWRSWAFDAGTVGQVPQDTTPNIADYEANCPEFVTSGANPACGDELPLGGPVVKNTDGSVNHNVAGDLTGSFYGADRSGGSISWLARDSADHGTLWAATSAGRIFVTHNADASDPSTVTWHRIDSSTSGASPTRFPSAIYVDPANTSHAWITYSGYNAVTPSTQGHVFDVTEGAGPGSGTFTNLNVEAGTAAFPTPTSDGDLPVSDVVRDDLNKTLYVSTDFGVLRGDNDGTGGWHVTAGMPRFEVMHLEIQPSSRVPTCTPGPGCKRVLYAATHSQGIWSMKIDN
jgi:hypothetical protein